MSRPGILALFLLPLQVASAQAPAMNKAENLVKRAIAYAQQNGIDKLIQQTNQANGIFHVGSGGELYLYIYDLQGMMKANGFKTDLVGHSRFDAKDTEGKFFVREFINTVKTSGKGWVDYKYPNPLDGKVEEKTAYIEGFQELIFCCGTYRK